MSKPRTCQHCAYYETGELDPQVNWMRCAKGRRLISDEQFTGEHRPFNDPDESIIRVTWDGWTEFAGTGSAMLDRVDCPDWKKRGFHFSLGNYINF